MLNALKKRLSEWRRKRDFPPEMQLQMLRDVVDCDNRWMAHNPIVKELTNRYLSMLAGGWESREVEDVSAFRRRIGLDPTYKQRDPDDACAPCAGQTMCVRPLYWAVTNKPKEPAMNNMEKHMVLLGMRVQDQVTGFSGVVSGISFDLYGCVQAIVNPGMDKEGKLQDQIWFDVSRLRVTSLDPVMECPNYEFGLQAEGRQGAAEKPKTNKA